MKEKQQMTIDQIRRAVTARPFRPFTIHMSDQRTFEVRHPELLVRVPRMERTIILAFPEEEAFEIIDLLHVSSLTEDTGNGRGRRRRAG
jgi:hypothetical protein